LGVGSPEPRREQNGRVGGSKVGSLPTTDSRLASDPGKAKAHAWRRLFARLVDLLVSYCVLAFVVELVAPDSALDRVLDNPWFNITFLVCFFIPVEVVLLGLFGSTLGKKLYAIRLEEVGTGRLTWKRALRRSCSVSLKGFALGIPLLIWIAMGLSYWTLKRGGAAPWDGDGRFLLRHDRIGWVRLAAISFVWALLVALSVVGTIERNSEPATGQPGNVPTTTERHGILEQMR
jgi:hypothetical protein